LYGLQRQKIRTTEIEKFRRKSTRKFSQKSKKVSVQKRKKEKEEEEENSDIDLSAYFEQRLSLEVKFH